MKDGKIVQQASFLMYAQVISSVIGLLYRTPLHYIMGDLGDGYYTYAFEWYTLVLLMASFSIPSAVSKVMAEKLAQKEHGQVLATFFAAFFTSLLPAQLVLLLFFLALLSF